MFFSNNVEQCINTLMNQIDNQTDYDVVVLMTRKLYSLYRSYVPNKLPQKSGWVITNEAIPLYGSRLRNKRVLVIDDIMIHGRTMTRVAKLLKSFEVAHVDYRVFAVSGGELHRERESVSAIKQAQFSVKFNRALWRKISRQIVNRIRGTLTPIRAASSYVEITHSIPDEQLIAQLSSTISEFSQMENRDPEFSAVQTYLCVYDANQYGLALNQYVNNIVLQVDFSSYCSGRAVLIPHVYMKPLYDDDIMELWNALDLPYEDASEIRVAQYRFIKYCISHIVTRRIKALLEGTQSRKDVKVEINNTDNQFCLPPELIKVIESCAFWDKFTSVLESAAIRPYHVSENSANIMENLFKSNPQTFLATIADCGFADEVLFENKSPKRIDGARICYLTSYLGVSITEITSALMQSIVTISYKPNNGWITERILPGEQAYVRILFEDCKRLIDAQEMTADARLRSYDEWSAALLNVFEDLISTRIGPISDEIMHWLNGERADEHEAAQYVKRSINDLELRKRYVQYLAEVNVFSLCTI